MALTVSQLLVESTEAESFTMLTGILDSLKFPASSWQEGSRVRTLVQLMARLHSDFTTTIATLTRGRFNDEATAGWLTLFSRSQYDNERVLALPTEITVMLTADAGAGPYPVALGDSIAVDQDANTWRNTAAGVVPLSGSVPLPYKAEIAAATRLPTALTLQTPLAGVNVAATDLLFQGVDDELDERLRQRNRKKWASLGYASAGDAYRLWALEALPAVSRVQIDDANPGGPGSIYVYIAGDDVVDSDTAHTVQTYIEGVDGIGRRPLTSNVSVFPAVPLAVEITAVIFFDGLHGGDIDMEDAVRAGLNAHFHSLPIGGIQGVVPIAGTYRAIMVVPGVVNMAITGITVDATPVTVGDVPIDINKVPIGTFNLTLTVA